MTTSRSLRQNSDGPGDSGPFTSEERAAMKDRAREARPTRIRQSAAQKAAEAERAVVTKIEHLEGRDRVIAEKFHALVAKSAPHLASRLWYGMPAYALSGTIICFFQPAAKFKARYATLGFSDEARLDDGAMWSTSFAVDEITPDVELQIEALLRRAVS